MDLLKVALERFFVFLAALIPGSAVLLVFILNKQSSLIRLWNTAALGYETKIAIVLLCTFSAGFVIQHVITRIGAGIGGFIRGFGQWDEKREKLRDQPQPWRDPVWRALLKGYLGASAPEDIPYISEETHNQRLKIISDFRPEGDDRVLEIANAFREKLNGEIADDQWSTWWEQLQLPAVLRSHDLIASMTFSLTGNFQSASVILLVAMFWTPDLRHWWLVLFCLYWLMDLILHLPYVATLGRDPWRSFHIQVEYLRSQISTKRSDGD